MNGFYNLTPLKLLLMSATHNVRTALDSKLDKWEKYLERFEAQKQRKKLLQNSMKLNLNS
jgi:predicted PolB exonuclease-like 3'-5' exonuclease